MYKLYIKTILVFSLVFFIACHDDVTEVDEVEDTQEIPEYLPMTTLILEDMSSFTSKGENWSIAGGAISDFTQEWNLETTSGTGMLVNQVRDQGKRDQPADGEHLYTAFEHGDIELELDFMVPDASNSGLYFMSRYELQIRDSYDTDELGSDDCGGIYAQRMTADHDSEVVPGKTPNVNAAKAPGLWQNYRVLFRAPRFDSDGNKVTNAKFEYVYHNGYLIHENVEVAYPTIEADSHEEVSQAPLKIQGNHGPLAIRNFKYKLYDRDTVAFSNMTYALYEGKYDYIPDYNSMTPIKTGEATSFSAMTDLAGKSDGFPIVFEGDINVPTSGDYLVETFIDDGGNLYIDDTLVVHNQGEPGGQTVRSIVPLAAGQHKFKVDCYSEKWGTRLVVYMEGPNMQKRAYLSDDILARWRNYSNRSTLNIDANESVEMIRGFVDHRGKKYTHTLSVGFPDGLNYSYDTRHNALLNLWKGKFADVNEMWNGRGHSQKLKPRNAVLPLNDGIPIKGDEASHDPTGFKLADDGRPIFMHTFGDVQVEEDIRPNKDGYMTRTLTFDNSGKEAVYRVAQENDIAMMNDNWISVGSQYYISISEGANHISIQKQTGEDQVIYRIPPGNSTLTYQIFW